MKTLKPENIKTKRQRGLSIIEVILAMGIFVVIASASAGVVIHSFSSNRLAEEQTKAVLLASEGLEAARSIKNQDFANLVSGDYEVVSSGGIWQFAPTPTPGGKYRRTVIVSDVYRDGEGEIVGSGGTLDEETKKVTSSVFWLFSSVRQNILAMKTYFTNWKSIICFWNDYKVVGSGDTVVGSKKISAEARDVFVIDGYAYLVSDYALLDRPEFFIFDINDPSGELSIIGSLNLEISVNAVYVSGDFAYLATNNSSQELMIINVSDPQNPQKVGHYDADPGILVGGMDVWVEETKVYLSTRFSLFNPEFYILEADKSDPYNVAFSLLGSRNLNSDINGIYLDGSYAYLAASDSNRELQVVDVSNPANPQLICWHNLQPSSWGVEANSVFVKDNKAYVVTQKNGSGDDYYVLELNPPFDGCPANPENFITKTASSRINNDVNDVFVYEGYVFLATEKGDSELMVASLENPTDFLLNIDLGGKAYGLYVYKCLAYVATGDNDGELQVIQPQ